MRVPDYDQYRCDEIMIEQYRFYVPYEGTLAGYTAFPSAAYGEMLDKIELRGNALHEGFRIQKEYEGKFVSNDGVVHSDNIFE